MDEYPWYKQIQASNPIRQGDFVNSCPIVVPRPEMFVSNGPIRTNVQKYNVVVMSQSCDLEYKKIDLVLVCPFWPLSEFERKSDFFKSTRGKNALRQGNVPGYHLLNKCDIDGFETEHLIVDFHNVYGVPFHFLTDFVGRIGSRLRLLPPYREHLSQAFARFSMRVGLPVDIKPIN
jgi:hypothetical protein